MNTQTNKQINGDAPELSLDKRVEQFKRDELTRLLDMCTEAQQTFFLRIFPLCEVSTSKLDSAIKLCERTVKKNQGEVGGQGDVGP